MRPVHNKGTSHPNYNPPSTLGFPTNAAAVIVNVMTKASPTLDDYLDVWLEAIKADSMASKPANYSDLCDARNLIKAKVQDIYKKAAVPLMDLFGDFCSYCETTLPGLVEVEHIVPKSQYPNFATEWKNFLLSCGPCNGAKSDQPTREDLKNLKGADLTTEQDCYDDIRTTYYAWPDLESTTHRLFPASMVHDPGDKGHWLPVHRLDAVNLDNVIKSVDLGSQTVRADLPTLGLSGVRVRVIIETSAPNTPQDRVVALCKLNDVGAKNTTYDRRLLNRTKAWFEILRAVKHILKIKDPVAFDAAWVNLCDHAASRGFFSIWVRIFDWGMHRDPNGQLLVNRLIYSLCNDPTQSPQRFPNTNTTHIP